MKRNWSKEEIEILRNKKAEGLGYSEIQKYLPNRSVDAINLKSSKLGISKDAGEPWTDKEIEILNRNLKSHFEIIGIPHYACQTGKEKYRQQVLSILGV
jgi:hypothetical protein